MDKKLLNKVTITSPTVKTNILKELTNIRQSLYEGQNGTWDCSTDEGKEGFEPLINGMETIASYLGLNLPDLVDPENICPTCGNEMHVVMVPDNVGKGLHEEYECDNCIEHES